MNNKNLLFIGLGIAVVAAIIFLMIPGGSTKKKVTQSGGEEDFTVFSSDKGYSDSIFPDAPLPYVEEPSLESEAINLWPTAIRSVKDDDNKEKIREQWKDFAAKYPKNVYILNSYKAPLSVEDEKKVREELDTVVGVNTFFARNISASKYAGKPGEAPITPKEPSVTPDEQRKYFDYKIRELQSRIELIEYAKENKALSQDQLPQADKDIANLKKEIKSLEEVSGTIPNS